jgi:hypothetical protein
VRPRTEAIPGGRHNRLVKTLADKCPWPLLWLMTTAVTLSGAAGFALLVAAMPAWIAASGDGLPPLSPASAPPAAIDAGAPPAQGPARRKSRCEECGWIESMRETEITVRLQDGSSRVIVDAHPGRSRLRERVIIIDGFDSSRATALPAGAP